MKISINGDQVSLIQQCGENPPYNPLYELKQRVLKVILKHEACVLSTYLLKVNKNKLDNYGQCNCEFMFEA